MYKQPLPSYAFIMFPPCCTVLPNPILIHLFKNCKHFGISLHKVQGPSGRFEVGNSHEGKEFNFPIIQIRTTHSGTACKAQYPVRNFAYNSDALELRTISVAKGFQKVEQIQSMILMHILVISRNDFIDTT